MTSVRAEDDTSTSGLCPVTVTDSSRAPTVNWMLTVAVKSAGRKRLSRLAVVNPSRLYERLYVPGRRSMMV